MAWCQKPLRSYAKQLDFGEILFLPPKLGKWAKSCQKIRFFEFKEKMVINFHCIYSISKIFIYCVPAQKSCSWDIGQYPLSQSDSRISKWTISPDQVDETVSLLACWYGQCGRCTLKLNKPKESTYFLHTVTISWKLFESFRGWYGQIWVWPVMLWDFKIDCMWKIDRWSNLIFCMLMEIHKISKLIKIFLGGHSQKWMGPKIGP